MNRKILAILIVLIAAVSIASVCAAELTKENDFDGKFKMNIYDNSTFEQVVDGTGQNPMLSNQSWSDNETALVCYYADAMDNVLSTLKTNTLYMDEPTTDGNFTVIENSMYDDTQEYAFKYAVGVSSPENDTVMIFANDVDLAKDYANTIVFE